MKIRFCNKDDENQIKKIWQYCFEDSDEYVDFYFKNKFSPENTVALEKNGNIISSIHLNQHKINLFHKEYDVSYVVGVSTLPESRGTGMMKELMQFSLRSMYERGQEVSILMPIDFRLYTPFGFQNCYDYEVVKLDVFYLKRFKINGDFCEVEKPEDLERIYGLANKRYNGYALRDKKYFEEFIEEMKAEGGYIYVNFRNGEPVGYIAYSMDSGTFYVRELYYIDISAYESILKFIFNHNTQCKNVEIMTSIDSPLYDLLDNPKESVFEKKPFMMGRVINFIRLIDKLEIPYFSDFKGVSIKIKDEYIKENDGLFKLKRNNGLVKAEKCDSDDYADEFTINEITSLFFGYKSIDNIEFLSGKKYKYKEEIRRMINSVDSIKINYINEYV